MSDEKELYPGHAEEVKKRAELASRVERAHAAVLPGALREAFGAEPARANGFALEPVTLGMTANLERIKSPLLEVVRIMREVFSQGSTESRPTEAEGDPKSPSANELFGQVIERLKLLKFEEEQVAETVFIFVRPQKRVRKLLDAGRDKFREAAMEELGDKLNPTQMTVLQHACTQHYIASFSTIVAYEAPPAENGEAVFTPPSASARTASAGGSIS